MSWFKAPILKIKRLFSAYSSFFDTFGHFSWLMGVIVYPIVGAMLGLWLAMAVHPLALPVPIVPPLVIAIREDMRRRKAELSGLKMISGKRIGEAREEYIELIQRNKKRKKGGDNR